MRCGQPRVPDGEYRRLGIVAVYHRSGPENIRFTAVDLLGVWMEMQFYRLVIAILAVWRVTHLLNAEDGPWDVIVRIRRSAGTGFWAGLLDCFNCLSLWIAAAVALSLSRKPMEWLFSWLAISGAACLLERLVRDPVVIQSVTAPAEGDIDDVLRSETLGVTEQRIYEGDARRRAIPAP